MAVCFELVANFGDDIEAARAAACVEPWPWTLPAGALRIPLHRPALSTYGPFVQVSILPVAVSHGVAADGSLPPFDLTDAELKELGRGLYGLLKQFDGYLSAMVGWNPEGILDIDGLATDWPEELTDGTLPGLVLADSLRTRLSLGPAWVPFRPGYLWLPFADE